jgi:hypothetical protein
MLAGVALIEAIVVLGFVRVRDAYRIDVESDCLHGCWDSWFAMTTLGVLTYAWPMAALSTAITGWGVIWILGLLSGADRSSD